MREPARDRTGWHCHCRICESARVLAVAFWTCYLLYLAASIAARLTG